MMQTLELREVKKQVDSIVLNATQVCNFRCRMCMCWTARKTPDYSTEEQILRAIEILGRHYVVRHDFIITGGEPLLVHFLEKIITACRKHGFRVSLTTNGSLLSESRLHSLIQAGLSTLSISLDSLNEETHDTLRGFKGSYGRIMRALKILEPLSERPRAVIGVVMMKPNIAEVESMIEWAEKKEIISNVFLQVISTPPNFRSDTEWTSVPAFRKLIVDDKDAINRVFDRVLALKNSGYKIANSVEQLENYRYYMLNLRYRNSEPCRIDRKLVFIDEYGMVRVCPHRKPLSNIRLPDFEPRIASPYPPALVQDIISCNVSCNSRINCSDKE